MAVKRLSPTDRRAAHIRAASDKLYSEHPGMTEDQICEEIAKLRHQGRTSRWQEAVEDWQRLVRENPENLPWAILQGAIFTAHKA